MISFVIAGVCRNVGSLIKDEIEFSLSLLKNFDLKKIVIIESDSVDNTVEVINQIALKNNKIIFKTAGNLSMSFAHRSERIAYCRNLYLDVLVDNNWFNADYLIVMDLDAVNIKLNCEKISQSLEFLIGNRGSAVTANQLYKYYDIWALRHPEWCNGDCWLNYAKLKKIMPNVQAHYVSNLSKMVCLPKDAAAIEVDSAFGGLAIYNINYIGNARYKGFEKMPICEHVHFSYGYKKNGGSIFILPSLINHDTSIHVQNAERFHIKGYSDSEVDFSCYV